METNKISNVENEPKQTPFLKKVNDLEKKVSLLEKKLSTILLVLKNRG